MRTFEWQTFFETGLDNIDAQHREIVELINDFGTLLHEQPQLADGTWSQMATHAATLLRAHFTDEEREMAAYRIDDRHASSHLHAHLEALAIVAGYSLERAPTPEECRHLHRYLLNWMCQHILGMDRVLGKQIDAIRNGFSPENAFELVQSQFRTDPAQSALVGALAGMTQLLSDQNRALVELSRSLEQRVSERTAELEQVNAQLERLALTDALTGLANRRAALGQLESMLADGTVSCLLIDTDGFKLVNDRFGHDAGDRVLRELSRTLALSVRTSDVVARLGGDEFVVLCPHTHAEGAAAVAENVRAAVAQLVVDLGVGAAWHGSVSIGVACAWDGDQDPVSLIREADCALYEAKRAGKNRVGVQSRRDQVA